MSATPRDDDAPSSVQNRFETADTWLDLLPIDTCARIASILPPWEKREDDRVSTDQIEEFPPVFPLAAVSPTQRQAIATAQAGVLRIERVNDCHHAEKLVPRWRSILGTTIREVHLPINVGEGQHVCDLLALPTITKAVIPNLSKLLRALLSQRSVKVLELQITNYVTINDENGLSLLPEVLRSCPVEKLCLTCHGCGGPEYRLHIKCMCIRTLCELKNADTPLMLRSLQLSCSSRKLGSLINALHSFPTLEEFCWDYTHFPDSRAIGGYFRFSPVLKRRLRALKSIGLINCGPVHAFVQDFGERITSISSRLEHNVSQLELLEKCPNITSIDLFLEEGAEAYFPTGLTTLRSVSLSWNARDRFDEQGYYTPHREELASFIRRNNLLEEIRFKNVNLSGPLLAEILASVGKRLKVLQVPICMQDDSPVDRFLHVIRLAIKHNPNLQELYFYASELNDAFRCSIGSFKILHVHEHDGQTGDCGYCQLRNRIDGWLLVLKRWLQQLREDCFDDLQNRLTPSIRPPQAD